MGQFDKYHQQVEGSGLWQQTAWVPVLTHTFQVGLACANLP